MSPGSDIVLVLHCDGLHHIFLTCTYKSPERSSAQPLGHRSLFRVLRPHRRGSHCQPHNRNSVALPFTPQPQCPGPTGTAWGQPGVWPSHSSGLVVRHWIHLSVSQVEASLRVTDKHSYFSFTDGEAEAQKSAFCLGPHKRPEREP